VSSLLALYLLIIVAALRLDKISGCSLMPDYSHNRQRRTRALSWPASRLTNLRHEIAAMAELPGVPMTTFIRSDVIAHLVAEHRRMFPEIEATPWDTESGQVCKPIVRRVAEG
jgi:hypothetical protein